MKFIQDLGNFFAKQLKIRLKSQQKGYFKTVLRRHFHTKSPKFELFREYLWIYGLFTGTQHFVDKAIFCCCISTHEIITLGVFCDGLDALTGMVGEHLVELLTYF